MDYSGKQDFNNIQLEIIYSNTIGQSSTKYTTLNQLNITKQILLNIYQKVSLSLKNRNDNSLNLSKRNLKMI